MNSAAGNHPWEKIPSNQDEFGRRKSSLGGIFIKSGCIRAKEIIPERNFHQIRMNLARENHPCEKISSNRDASRRKKSSLDEYSAKSGCIWLSQLFRIFIHWIPAAWSCWNSKRMQSEHRQPGTAGIRWHFNFCRIIIVSIYYAAFLLKFRGFGCGRSQYPHRMVPDSTFLY